MKTTTPNKVSKVGKTGQASQANKSTTPTKQTKTTKPIIKPIKKKSDNTAFVTGVVGFFIALAVFAYFYQAKSTKEVSSELAYAQLKPMIIEETGVVGQMTAAVQVNEEDSGWLKDNEKAIYDAYKKEMESMKLDTLSSKEGFIEAQNELKRRLNLIFKTDKIQAVLITDLVLQHDQSMIEQ